ncbi:MAG: hypothetical protein HYZ85_04090 [Candidatus Omnitrophica bacterium]|nr:hypothetical protein [Candidatus Omnitrophota bacterium]
MRERSKKRLGELLVEDGLITREMLQEALDHQKKEGGLIGQILIRLGHMSEEGLIAELGKQLQVPYIPVANYSVNMEIAATYDEQLCKKSMLLVLDQDEKRVFIATADPLNDTAVEELTKGISLKPQLFISTPTEILNMLDLVYSKAQKIKKAS